MTEQSPEVQKIEPLTFKEQWEAKKLLKQAKKKARKTLQSKGFSHSEATKLVKQSIDRISNNKPIKRAAGRGG